MSTISRLVLAHHCRQRVVPLFSIASAAHQRVQRHVRVYRETVHIFLCGTNPNHGIQFLIQSLKRMAKELLDVDALTDVSLNGLDLANVVLRFGHILIVEIQGFFIGD